MFILHKCDGSIRPRSMCQQTVASGVTPKVGLPLYWYSNKLALCAGANKPEYICMTTRSAALSAAEDLPVMKIQEDMVFAVPSDGDNSGNLGDAVQIKSDGSAVNTTESSSPHCRIVGWEKDGKSGDTLYVRII